GNNMAVSIIGPKFYAWGRDGKPLAFGKVYTYKARTNAPKETYQSEDGLVSNDNPVILNGEGYANIYLDGSYKVVVKDTDDSEIWTEDPVTARGGEEWVNCMAATYLSASSFKITGNATDKFEEGRRIRIDNNAVSYEYSTILSSVFAGGETTVSISNAVVATGIVNVYVSIVGRGSLLSEVHRQYTLLTNLRNAKGLDALQDGDMVSTGGHTNIAIGGLSYVYDASDTGSADNNGTLIVVGSKRFKAKLDKYVTPEMFGHIPGSDDSTAACVAAVNTGLDVYFNDGIYNLVVTSAAGTLQPKTEGQTLTFANKAFLRWGMQGTYYPAIAVVKTNNVSILNPNLIWTGKLVFDPAGDFVSNTDLNIPANRYGADNTYKGRDHCSGILALESGNLAIKGFNGRSEAGDSTSVIHQWLFASRCDELDVFNMHGDDCVLVILSEGGIGGTLDSISGDRLSQDIGIPGHIIYSFRALATISNVKDGGIESGADANLRISHTVSQKTGGTVISGIVSRRAEGPINLSSADGCVVSDITWEEPADYTSNINPKFYFVTSGPS
ncbi:MAG: hypothetical protein RPR40_01865, partial [Bermanella sp.]